MNRRIAAIPAGTPNLEARLTPAERGFRRRLLARLIQAQRPLRPAELEEPASAGLLAGLQSKGLLVREGDGSIAGAYPVSTRPTSHRVRLADGRSFYAMCAVDALGCAFEFAQDVAVSSVCSQCRVELGVSLAAGRVSQAEPPTIQVLHVDLDHYADWAASC